MTQRLEEVPLRRPAVGSRVIRDHLTLRGMGDMAGMWHVRRILLTAALAIGATAAAIDAPSAPVEAATTTCGPLGTLKTYQLNDRCNYGLLDLSLVTDAVVVDVLDGVGLFATLTRLH